MQLYLMSIVVIFIRPSYQKGPNLSSIFKLISTCWVQNHQRWYQYANTSRHLHSL